MRNKMRIQHLNEMPELRLGDRPSAQTDLCNAYNVENIKNIQWITPRYDGVELDSSIEIFHIGDNYYCGDKKNNKLVSILTAPPTKILKGYSTGGTVIHEESIDTCEEYKRKGIIANFYYSLLKIRFSILSDYKHYTGTQFLWKSLSKKTGVTMLIYKNHALIESNYDLEKDELNVWSSNTYLIMATLQSFHESRLMLNFE